MYGIKVTKKAIRYLDIYIEQDNAKCYNQNWIRIYHDVEKLSKSWKRTKITIVTQHASYEHFRFQS